MSVTDSLSAVAAEDVAELIAKQKLVDNMVEYCRGQDRKELELTKSTFWPEATDNHGMFNGSAHEFCEWSLENQKVGQYASHHYVTNILSEIDGDFARRESAVIYVMVKPGDQPTDVMGGRYRDLCERRDGVWKVLRRTVIFDHVAQYPGGGSLGEVFGGVPDTARVGALFPVDPIYDGEW